MGPIRIGVGTEWFVDGLGWRVIRQPDAATLVAKDQKFGRESEFRRTQVLELYATGELLFSPGDDDSLPPQPTDLTNQDLRDLSEENLRIVMERWAMIEPLTHVRRLLSNDDFNRRVESLQSQGIVISRASLRRYFATWKKSDGDRRSLMPRTNRSGGRGGVRRKSLFSRYPAVRKIADDAIRSIYLTTERRPIAVVVRRVLEDLQRLNARLPSENAIPIPKERTLSRAVARRIRRMDPWEVDCQRWGKKIADRKHAPRSPQQQARRILERVEVDHSRLKVVVGTEAGPIGQPWLSILIDYYSRMVTGFCLGFDPPSYPVLMESLRQSILPKTQINERYNSIAGQWPCYGIPEKIVCDRGADFISKDLENAAFQLGVVLDFNPPQTPHFKGCVESFFGGLNDQLLSSLPGRTFRSWEKRADHNADDGPFITYEALLEIIHVYLVDVYAQSKHPTIPKTRLEVWQESEVDHPPFLPGSPEDLIVLLSRSAERKLSPRGIELGGMFYTGDELLALRAELAANNLSVDRMTIRHNPWNLGSIWVLNPIDGAYIQAKAVDATLEGMTEYQWKVLRRTVRERFDSPDHQMSLARGRNTIRDIAENTMTKPSRRRRSKSARFLNESSSADTIRESSSDSTSGRMEIPDVDVEQAFTSDENIEAVTVAADELIDTDLDDWGIDTTVN